MSLRYALWSLFSPSQWLIAGLLLGGWFLWLGWRRSGGLLLALSTVALLLLGVLPVGAWLAASLESRYPPPEPLPSRIDGIVQLGGAERVARSAQAGAPQLNEAAERYFVTLELARRYPQARVVFSGNGHDRPAEGVVGGEVALARRLYAAAGLEPPQLSFETRSRDTCDSATGVRELVRPQAGETWILVTTALHLPRAVACFEAAGWQVVPYPADFRGSGFGLQPESFRVAENLALFDIVAHEWLGMAYYRWAGRLDPAAAR